MRIISAKPSSESLAAADAALRFAEDVMRETPDAVGDGRHMTVLNFIKAIKNKYPDADLLDLADYANEQLCHPRLSKSEVAFQVALAAGTVLPPDLARQEIERQRASREPAPEKIVYVLPKAEQDKIVKLDEIPKFKLARDIKPVLDRPALVDGLLSPNALSFWYGPSNVYKSFLLMDLGACIAMGREWFGRKVQQTAVMYLAAEGGAEIVNRVAAIKKHYDATDFPFVVCEEPVNLCSQSADPIKAFIAMLQSAGDAVGCRVGFIVIDTLNATFGGGDENSTKDMTTYKNRLLEIKSQTGAHIAVIHHVGKDASRGARGSGALYNAADSALEFKEGGKIANPKQRDMEKSRPFGFAMHTVEIGAKADGAPVTSLVVRPAGIVGTDFGPKPIRAGSLAGKALTVIEDLTLSGKGASIEEWRDEFVRRHYEGKRKAGWTAFNRATGTLRAAGRFHQDGDAVVLSRPETSS